MENVAYGRYHVALLRGKQVFSLHIIAVEGFAYVSGYGNYGLVAVSRSLFNEKRSQDRFLRHLVPEEPVFPGLGIGLVELDLFSLDELVVVSVNRLIDLYALPLHSFEKVDGVRFVDISAAKSVRIEKIAADAKYGHSLVAAERKHRSVVLEKDNTFFCSLQRYRSAQFQMSLVVWLEAVLARSLKHEAEHVADVAVDDVHSQRSVLCRPYDIIHLGLASAHHKVIARPDAIGGHFRLEPVRHHHAVPAPFLPENSGEQFRACTGARTVDIVV